MIFNFQRNVSAETKAIRQKIAVYMGKGFTQTEIANILGKSQGTISCHEKEISKFGTEWRRDVIAVHNGIVHTFTFSTLKSFYEDDFPVMNHIFNSIKWLD